MLLKIISLSSITKTDTMKKIMLLLLSLMALGFLNAQVCAIDYSHTAVGIYPDTLPDATAGDFYDQDITFVLPTDTLGISFTNFQIISANVPLGMSWECSNAANGCNYNPQLDPYGCARVYGTPIIPGFYEVEIGVIADLSISSGNFTTFTVYMNVLPSSQSNAGFAMNPASGCDQITVDFINNNPSSIYTPIPNLTSGLTYHWDFDNGTQSNLENPPAQTFNGPDTFAIQYICNIDTLGFFMQNVTVNAVACTDVWPYGDPDLYIELYDGSGNLVHTTIQSPDDSNLPTSWNMNIPLINPPYFLMVWDDDTGQLIGSAPDNCVDNQEGSNAGIDIIMPNVMAFGNTQQIGNNGGLNLTYTINKPVFEIDITDTLIVGETPDAPIITYDASTNTLSTPDLGYLYQWYLDGNPIPGATGFSIEPGNGVYHVAAFNGFCFANSNEFQNTASINDLTGASFKVFPNPAKESVTIQFKDHALMSLKILDVTGRIVVQHSLENMSEITVPVNELKSGFYNIILTDGINNWSKKLVIQ